MGDSIHDCSGSGSGSQGAMEERKESFSETDEPSLVFGVVDNLAVALLPGSRRLG